tara:strand:+ start:1160 stop:1951 length:792 start_codon:yes stop_codon:yes gene_type:complete
MLQYSKANAKLKKLYKVEALTEWLKFGRWDRKANVYSLDLLSGWSCPFAKDCKSKVHETGNLTKSGNLETKLKDGIHTLFRCFSASQEVLLPNVYKKRKANYELLKACESVDEMADLLDMSMPIDAGIVRQHVGGDFFNEMYFLAWLELASRHPDTLFYAYTKSLSFWVKHMDKVNSLNNVVLTASRGGYQDHLIEKHNLRESVVVYSEQEADSLGLEIDHDDSHAALNGGDFALLIHGTQPKGSEAGKAVRELKGVGSYGRK